MERELRIGNLVLHKGSIVEFDSHKAWHIHELKPVLLTEEWLVKFGFKGHNDELVNCDLWGKWVIGDFEIIEDDDHFIFNELYAIRTVHQLQNLYFTLTGQELTIHE